MGLVFRYMIEFPVLANPLGRKEIFDASFRQFLQTGGFDYMMGSQGGSRRTYGHIGRKQRDAQLLDRELLREWLEKQPIKCVARIGPLEEESSEIDLLSVISETVLAVDNLTDDDRSQTAVHAEKITKLIQQRARPTNE